LNWQLILIVLLVAVAAAWINGFLGFGFGIVSMGLLTLSRDVLFATAFVNLMVLLVELSILMPLWRRIQWRLIGPLVFFGLIGLVAGVELVISIDPQIMRRVLGITIILFALWSWLDPRQGHVSRYWSIPSGLAFGTLSGAFNTGGPPLVAYVYRHPLSPDQLKATLQFLFFSVTVVRIPIIFYKGLFTEAVIQSSLYVFPFVILATLLGLWMARRVSPERFRKTAWAAFAMMGIWLAISG